MSDSSKKGKGKKAGTTSGKKTGVDDGGRLEKAVQDLLVIAKDEFSERASSLVEDTTAKLKRELQARRERDEQSARDSENKDHHADDPDAHIEDEHYSSSPGTSRRFARRAKRRRKKCARRNRFGDLTRSRYDNKIAGVCSGIARHRGMDTWVVRCIAVTGMVFIPQVTFPAYIIAWIVLSKEPRFENAGSQAARPVTSAFSRRQRPPATERKPDRAAQPARKNVVEKPPRFRLRNVKAELNQVELRLRRMESHVTSGHYELQKELNRIDN